ncbi:MAG TPA: hypothetical protein VHE55_02070 [Fimbriimonadaceae bacterium]|nr:hypothetical protein [Fimbriimonadaceae bacterium]
MEPLGQITLDTTVLVALIGVASSTVCVFLTAWLSRRIERYRIEANQAGTEKLEELKAKLSETETRRKARLDYEYEALKRLYTNVEPLVFQLIQESGGAMHRVLSLARSANDGSLSGKESWLSSDGYYLRSTIYRLMAPLAIYRLIQRKLTLVDLSLEPWIHIVYALCESAYYSFTDDFKLAEGCPTIEGSRLEYAPNEPDWQARRRADPKVHWRQGFPIGVLDQIIDAMAVREEDGYRIVNFGEFDERIAPTKSFALAADVFIGFHPGDRPVLWRILLAQYHLHSAIQIAADSRPSLGSIETEFRTFLTNGMARGINHRRSDQKRSFNDIAAGFGDPNVIRIVSNYTERVLEELLQSIGPISPETKTCP